MSSIDEIRVTFRPGSHIDQAKAEVAELVRLTGRPVTMKFNDQEFVCKPSVKIEEKQKPVDMRGQVEKVLDGDCKLEDVIKVAPHLFPWLKT